MEIDNIAILLALLPLLGAAIVGLNTGRIPDKIAQGITCLFVCISALCSIYIFHYLNIEGEDTIHLQLFRWFSTGSFIAYWSIYIDVLTSVMLIVLYLRPLILRSGVWNILFCAIVSSSNER